MESHANTYLSSINIDLHSDDADVSINDGHKIFHLRDKIRVPVGTHALIGVSSFHCVYGFYQFRLGINDSFDLTIDGITINISITPGNYAITELLTVLNSALTTANLTFGLTVLSMNANYTENKLYLTTSPNKAVQFSNVLCWSELGFENDEGQTYSSSQVHYMPNLFNLAGDPSIYIRVENQLIENVNSKHISGVLANIPVPSMFGEYIFYNPSNIQYFRSSIDLSKFDISILDQYMNEISVFNTNAPWRITFSIHFSYDKDVIVKSPEDLILIEKFKKSLNIDDKKKD